MKRLLIGLWLTCCFYSVHSANIYVDATVNADVSSGHGSWSAAIHPDSFYLATVNPGDYVWMRNNATITSALDWSVHDGATNNLIHYKGVKSTTTNEPPVFTDIAQDSADTPLWTLGTYQFDTGDSIDFGYMHLVGSASQMVDNGSYNRIFKCILHHTQATSNTEYVVGCGGRCTYDSCVVISDNGSGYSGSSGMHITNGRISARKTGVLPTGGSMTLTGVLITGCERAVYTTADNSHLIQFNNFYDNDTILKATTDANILFKSNICYSNGIELSWSTPSQVNWIINNLIDELNVINVDTTGFISCLKNVIGDPQWVDIVNGNDSLGAGSPAINSAYWR